MIREKQSKLGCAAVIYKTSEWNYNFLFTCNYAETNLANEKVYDAGRQCSKCGALGSGFKCGVRYGVRFDDTIAWQEKCETLNDFVIVSTLLSFSYDNMCTSGNSEKPVEVDTSAGRYYLTCCVFVVLDYDGCFN